MSLWGWGLMARVAITLANFRGVKDDRFPIGTLAKWSAWTGGERVSGHIFVDESKERGYVVVAGVVLPERLGSARKAMRSLVLRGQSRVHFHTESPARRRQIITTIATIGARATVYTAGSVYQREIHARAACLEAVVADAAATGAHMLVLEQDDSLLIRDRRLLFDLTRKAGCADTLRYEHHRASSEVLLLIPDAVAWCWARAGSGGSS